MSGRSLELRAGWLPGLGAIALSGATGALVVVEGDSSPQLVCASVGGAVAILIVGLLLGSDRLVGFASIPMLISAVESSAPLVGAVSVRPLIIGCLWFVTVELAWSSIERRDGVVRPAAVDRQRVYEVSVVVVVAIVIGMAATFALPLAPTRTLMVRGVILGVVVAVMAEAVRRLRLAESPSM